MDLRRVRVWEWLTGLAGVALLVSLFLPWYGAAGHTATGWQSLTVIDVVLAVVALGAVALVVVTATQRTAAVPQGMTAVLAPFLLAAAVLALLRLLHPPGSVPIGAPHAGLHREIGPWLAAASSIAALVFNWRSMGDSRFPKAMRPRLDIATVPSPTADGERRDVPS